MKIDVVVTCMLMICGSITWLVDAGFDWVGSSNKMLQLKGSLLVFVGLPISIGFLWSVFDDGWED